MQERRFLQDSRAAGALVALMVILPLVLISLAAYSHRGFAEMQASSQESVRAHALYIAHAAVQKAAQELMQDPDFRGERKDVPFGGGRYSFSVEGDEGAPELGERFRVQAEATYGEPGQDPVGVGLAVILSSRTLSVVDHAVASAGPIFLGEDAGIGDAFRGPNPVYSGWDGGGADRALEGDDDARVYGKVRLVTETVQSDPPTIVPGPIRYGAEPLPFPTFDLPALEAKARSNTSNPQYPGGAYFTGRTTFRDETLRGVIYVDGEVVLRGVVTVDGGCIVGTSTAAFTVRGDLTLRTDDDPMTGTPHLAILKVGGATLKFENGYRVDIEGFIFTDGQVRLQADGEVRGGIIADTTDSVQITGACTVLHKAIDLADLAEEIQVTAIERLAIDSWREEPDHDPGEVYPGGGPGPAPPPGGPPGGGMR